MPIDVIVVGAGIGGLCAALALRQAGHSVQIFEKSKFATETGAAVALSPNGARVLSSLGFSFERARACVLPVMESVDGVTLEPLTSVDFGAAADEYGAPFMSIHRVDFHKELLRLALDGGGATKPISLHLDSAVAGVEEGAGGDVAVRLRRGTVHGADLVVCADGVHSATRRAVLGPDEEGRCRRGMSVFRVLVPTAKYRAADGLERLREWKSEGNTIFADTSETSRERHLVWYPCRDGEVQNIAGVHPGRETCGAESDTKAGLLAEFGHFHPDLVRLLSLAEDVGVWELPYYEPFNRWTRNNAVLVGDAAHPMLPFGAQGANQAIEDAGALGVLFDAVQAGCQVHERLELFEKIRRKRASMIQVLSSVRIGREQAVTDALLQFADPGHEKCVPQNFQERVAHALGHNVLEECRKALALEIARG